MSETMQNSVGEISPNPAGEPGRFALTEVKANSAVTGMTNNSFTICSGQTMEATVIHKNTMLTIPEKGKQKYG